MTQPMIPVGISDFEKIRRNGYCYIDKSGLIADLVEKEPAEVTLITRPRRFGKTLAMHMLACFFDLRRDSRDLFRGLKITENAQLCRDWMNQYPTIFFTFKNVDGLSFSTAYGQLAYEISRLYEDHAYLLDSDRISSSEKVLFRKLRDGNADEIALSRSLQLLSQLLGKHYEKKTILLLDEYDVPLAKASAHGYYDRMLEIVRSMLTTSLKDNYSLRFALITGCLRISKESIFTGTNNFVSDSISSSGFRECFGFTQENVDRLLQDTGNEAHADAIKTWYDGYHFGSADVYCPWDVMNYLRDLQTNPKAQPISYWRNTSDNAIIRSFIDHAGASITGKLETLLAGGSIRQRIEENLTYDFLHSSEDNLWSILYLTGYLTGVKERKPQAICPDRAIDSPDKVPPASNEILDLMIPNAEIREIFQSTIIKWFDDSAKGWDRHPLFTAIWAGDSQTATKELNKLLRRTISYHDYKEDFYHAFLAGIFTGAGYIVESNREHGEGRSDVLVHSLAEGQVAIFEIKRSQSAESLADDCQKALQQIDARMYAREYEDSCDKILCYGISFFKKRCLAEVKTLQTLGGY